MRRFLRDITSKEFLLILAATVCAMFGVVWWVAVPLTVAGLSLSSFPKYVEQLPRAREAGAEWAVWQCLALSGFNNVVCGVAAFVLGVGIRWLWF